MKLKPGQHIHLVGIGGSGLSAIARILLGQGYSVSGSDRNPNELTEALARDGATIYQEHDPRYIDGADALIITSAVKNDHIEVAAAHGRDIPIYKRQDIIADLMIGKTVIAVAGTKGKTTTTSMTVHILRECGLSPSYLVGGIMGNTGTNAGVGKGDIFVVEADEYDHMFLGLRPDIAVITNVEYDHPDFFKTPAEMTAAFWKFINLLSDSPNPLKSLIACADDPVARKLALDWRKLGHASYTYGFSEDADFRVSQVKVEADGTTSFRLENPSLTISHHRLSLVGKHNVVNSVAAMVATSRSLSVATGCVNQARGLLTFKSTARRFDLRSDFNQIAIIDDYAHNPMSIRAVLEAAKQRYPERELWAIWQPHTYSRTQALFDDFTKAFDFADHVLITDIYAAREAAVPGVTSASVVAAMQHPDARLTPAFADTVTVLSAEVKPPAVVLIMSAGDAPQIGIDYLSYLQTRANVEITRALE